jgi:para-nitrobenzyl esterase
MPPAPASSWSAPRDATRYGPAAAQVFDPHEAPLGDFYDDDVPRAVPRWVGSEDCLTLNVWTRSTGSARRPVIVWIHGGANWLEGSRLSAYDGAPLAAFGDVVVCSMNYRLGIFGFVDVSILGGAKYAGAHSLGLLDQLAAIDWIASNAHAFGGDPDNITLVGESAGSMDISWLLTTGRLPAGVRRAMLMSGVAGVPGVATHPGGSFYSEAEGQRQAQDLFALLGIDSMSTLMSASTGALLDRLAAVIPQRDMLFYWDSLFYPRVDGQLLRETPFEFFARGGCQEIAMVIGWTTHESGLWTLWDDLLDKRGTQELADRLPALPPGVAAPLAKLYEGAMPRLERTGMQLLTEAMFVMPSLQLAEAHTRMGGRCWLYEFGWEVDDPRLRATHAADVGFWLGTYRSGGVQALIGAPRDQADAQAREGFAQSLMNVVFRFADTGEPGAVTSGAAAVAWPTYELATRPVMRLHLRPRLVCDPYVFRREWWMRHVYGAQAVPAERLT